MANQSPDDWPDNGRPLPAGAAIVLLLALAICSIAVFALYVALSVLIG